MPCGHTGRTSDARDRDSREGWLTLVSIIAIWALVSLTVWAMS